MSSSLREIHKDYHIGGAVSVASWAPKTLVSHRISFGPAEQRNSGNAMKPDYLQPREGAFNFREPDNLVASPKNTAWLSEATHWSGMPKLLTGFSGTRTAG